MEKVLTVISDNNKGKFVTKGFASAFKDLSYFVIEKKIYDINIDEINHISPDIIFIFWTDMTQKENLIKFFDIYDKSKSTIIHCAEQKSEIPPIILKDKTSYIFTSDSKNKKNRFIQAINPNEYKTKFNGYNFNITFCGNPAYDKREKTISKLIHNYGEISLFCRSYDYYKSLDEIYKKKYMDDYFIELYKKSYKGYVESSKELSMIYSSSKINIDLENEGKTTYNYRCLEIMSSGGFLIAPYNEQLITNFEDGKEIETYTSDYELIDKINFYLNNLNLSKLIAINGKKNVVNNHCFYDRLKAMMKVIYDKNTGS